MYPNEFGYKFVVYSRVKCSPIDCALSKWSGFSACSKDCEGGAQSDTRSVLMLPKNGGTACNTVHESRPCHTGFCCRMLAQEVVQVGAVLRRMQLRQGDVSCEGPESSREGLEGVGRQDDRVQRGR